MSINIYDGTDLIKIAGKGKKGDTPDLTQIEAAIQTNANNISTLTSGLNTLSGNVGTLSNLTTTEKSSIVGAINEIDSHADTNATNIQTNATNITSLGGRASVLESSGNWRTGLRYKNLGTSFTQAQQQALAAGDLSDFWNGDYWVINNKIWRILDNSGLPRRRGDTNFDSNCLIVKCDSNLVAAEAYLIDSANDSGNGYANCAYRTRTDGKGRAKCKELFVAAFGSSHIASHRELMSTARNASGASAWAWTDADVELESEVNVYGHPAWGGGKYNIGDRWGQFMLYKLAPYMAINRSENRWLRDIQDGSASLFAYVAGNGDASGRTPSVTWAGVSPYAIVV